MKTRARLISLALALVALLGIAGLANAQMMGHGMTQGYAGSGLSPEKQAVAQKIYADYNAATASLRQQLTSKQYELDAQLVSATPDDKKVQALTKEVSDLRAKLFEAQVNLQSRLTKEGVPSGNMGGMGMMGAGMMSGMGCGMMGGHGMMGI